MEVGEREITGRGEWGWEGGMEVGGGREIIYLSIVNLVISI